jgi:hypothetical protein
MTPPSFGGCSVDYVIKVIGLSFSKYIFYCNIYVRAKSMRSLCRVCTESVWTLLRCIRVRGVCTDSTRTPHSLHGVHKDIWGSVTYWNLLEILLAGGTAKVAFLVRTLSDWSPSEFLISARNPKFHTRNLFGL